jgi:hypothetical protein
MGAQEIETGMSDMPGVPREIDQAATACASRLWEDLVHSARLPADVAELAALRPTILHTLRVAYLHGAFDRAKPVLAALSRRR